MKNLKTSILTFTIAIIVMAAGCKKDTIPDPTATTGNSINTPNFVAVYYPPKPPATGQWKPDGYIFYDLNHDDNKDKKFFIARFYLSGNIDSMAIYKGPLPIDSTAENWPSEVKSAGFGYNTDIVINAYKGMRQMGVDATGTKSSYLYDSLKTLKIISSGNGWGSVFYEGVSWLNGKTPQGFTTIKIPDGVGSFTNTSVMFYFKENNCIRWGGVEPPISISSLVPGSSAGTYDWPNVNNVISNENIWGFRTHYFIDFKNWRFFTWQEECAAGGCLTIKLTMSGYKSLDNLLKWPAGWGKQ